MAPHFAALPACLLLVSSELWELSRFVLFFPSRINTIWNTSDREYVRCYPSLTSHCIAIAILPLVRKTGRICRKTDFFLKSTFAPSIPWILEPLVENLSVDPARLMRHFRVQLTSKVSRCIRNRSTAEIFCCTGQHSSLLNFRGKLTRNGRRPWAPGGTFCGRRHDSGVSQRPSRNKTCFTMALSAKALPASEESEQQ